MHTFRAASLSSSTVHRGFPEVALHFATKELRPPDAQEQTGAGALPLRHGSSDSLPRSEEPTAFFSFLNRATPPANQASAASPSGLFSGAHRTRVASRVWNRQWTN